MKRPSFHKSPFVACLVVALAWLLAPQASAAESCYGRFPNPFTDVHKRGRAVCPHRSQSIRVSRPLRIEFEDALYQVTACGDRPEPIVEDLDRDATIAGAYLEGGYTRSAIAQATGLSVSWFSRLIAAHEAKGKTCPT